jgi:ATP phosphoribosyltransferase
MVPSADAADSQVDVTESCITMNERNVVIKDEEIDNHHRKLNQQGQEKSHNSSVLSLLVIVIEFEEIAI